VFGLFFGALYRHLFLGVACLVSGVLLRFCVCLDAFIDVSRVFLLVPAFGVFGVCWLYRGFFAFFCLLLDWCVRWMRCGFFFVGR